MRKTLKVVLIVVGGLIALIIVAMLLVTVFVDPNDYKGAIAHEVEQKTGRKLVFEGNIGLSLFPWVGLELGPTQLSNAKGFKNEPFAKIQSADIRVKIIPLLSRKIEMAKVSLSGLTLNLERNAQGKTNWEDLTASQAAPKEAKQEAPSGGGRGMEMLYVGGVELKNATVTWDDQKERKYYALRDINLNVGSVEPNKPIDFSLGFDMTSKEPPMEVSPRLKGVVKLNIENKVYEIDNMKLDVVVRGDSIPGKELKPGLTATIRADLGKQTLTVSDLNLEALGVKATGDLKANHIMDKATYAGNLNIPSFNPRDVMKNLGQQPPQTADANALQKASAALTFNGSTDSFNLKEMTARLDETNIKGNAAVKNFSNPDATFTFTVDKIDADRYLPPKSKEKGQEAKAGAPPAKTAKAPEAKKPDFGPLRKLHLKGDVTIEALKVKNLSMNDMKAQITANNGVLAINPFTVNLYSGSMTANVSMDVKGQEPKLDIKNSLAGVQAGPLLNDLTGKDMITGTTEFKADITASGADADAIERTLNGTAAFAFKEGAIKGVNIARMIREATSVLKGQSLQAAEEPLQTDFAVLSGSVDLTNGVAVNKNLTMKSPLLRVTGEGKINIPQETIDYLLTANVVGTLAGQGGKSLEQLGNIPVPIRVSGTFTEPKFNLDTQALAKALAEGKLKAETNKLEESLKQKFLGGQQEKSGEGVSSKAEDELKKLIPGSLFK